MDLINQLQTTGQRFSNCLPYVPLDQLADVTSVLCQLVRHACHQEEAKFHELNSSFLHILSIVETLMQEYQKRIVHEPAHIEF